MREVHHSTAKIYKHTQPLFIGQPMQPIDYYNVDMEKYRKALLTLVENGLAALGDDGRYSAVPEY